ncbi:hypothetical protein BJ508DRAFT_331866 [Ascobolus immersus RN42]|uniref:Uncharacterized protein n=1 Tax=Ascobolus immersus RN42 TaxID=1160509 RepID=A0A3N4I1A2_ASCIM|nr:hypothetical protein BJ508DRAFT_331866 [Ascobolus immersus RN42]
MTDKNDDEARIAELEANFRHARTSTATSSNSPNSNSRKKASTTATRTFHLLFDRFSGVPFCSEAVGRLDWHQQYRGQDNAIRGDNRGYWHQPNDLPVAPTEQVPVPVSAQSQVTKTPTRSSPQPPPPPPPPLAPPLAPPTPSAQTPLQQPAPTLRPQVTHRQSARVGPQPRQPRSGNPFQLSSPVDSPVQGHNANRNTAGSNRLGVPPVSDSS